MTTMTIATRVWHITARVDGDQHIYGVWANSQNAAVNALVARLDDEGWNTTDIQRTALAGTSRDARPGTVLRYS